MTPEQSRISFLLCEQRLAETALFLSAASDAMDSGDLVATTQALAKVLVCAQSAHKVAGELSAVTALQFEQDGSIKTTSGKGLSPQLI